MKNFQKLGGFAALYMAAAYILGIVGFKLVADYSAVADPVEKVAFLMDNQAITYILHLLVYVVWGVFMVVLALALYQRLKTDSPAIMQIATALGLIWAGLVIAAGMVFNIGMDTVVDLFGQDPAQAATVWLAIESVFEGLGGGNEIVGGLWVLLVSWTGLRTGGLPRLLNYLGLVIAVAGILSAIPPIGEIGAAIFGLGQIVWFVWLGIVMLRNDPSAAA
jgi:hypothetical protein